jgi:chromosome partitioning protein
MQRDISVDDILLKTDVAGLDLLPSNIDLSAAEVQLVGEVAREQVAGRALQPAWPPTTSCSSTASRRSAC